MKIKPPPRMTLHTCTETSVTASATFVPPKCPMKKETDSANIGRTSESENP